MPLVAASAALMRIRASALRGVLRWIAMAVVSATGLGWMASLVSQAYSAGLDIWGWSPALPFFGVAEAMAADLGGAAAVVLSLTIFVGLALMTGARWFASMFAVLATILAIASALALLSDPYRGGLDLRQGVASGGWVHVVDRVCATADPKEFPVSPTQAYWLINGTDSRVVLLPVVDGKPVGRVSPVLVPRDAVAAQVIEKGARCPVRVAR